METMFGHPGASQLRNSCLTGGLGLIYTFFLGRFMLIEVGVQEDPANILFRLS